MIAEVRSCRDEGAVLRIDHLLNVQGGGGEGGA